jgi:hypothetical protein
MQGRVDGPPQHRLLRLNLSLVSALLFVGLAAGGCGQSTSSQQACPGPRLGVSTTASAKAQPSKTPITVQRGGTLYASGSGFDARCANPTAPRGALAAIRLYVVQGSSRVSVAQVNASGADNGFALSFGVPGNLAPGPAALVAQLSQRADAPQLAVADFVVAPPRARPGRPVKPRKRP